MLHTESILVFTSVESDLHLEKVCDKKFITALYRYRSILAQLVQYVVV